MTLETYSLSQLLGIAGPLRLGNTFISDRCLALPVTCTDFTVGTPLSATFSSCVTLDENVNLIEAF